MTCLAPTPALVMSAPWVDGHAGRRVKLWRSFTGETKCIDYV